MEMGKWTIINSENIWTPGAGLPSPRDNIHVYYHNIERSPSPKPLGQSKPNFMEERTKVYRSHDQDVRYN